MMAAPANTLVAALWPVTTASRYAGIARFAVCAVAGALALTLSAKAQVPFYPVPLTLQTLVVLMLGAAFGARLAAAAVALYLVEGALGLPVFAGTPEKGLGLAYMFGPTGGFLGGFLLAAAFIGFCAERGWGRHPGKLLLVMFAGHALILAAGFLWLAMIIGPQAAYAGAIAPFFLATVIKTILAAALMPALWRLTGLLRA